MEAQKPNSAKSSATLKPGNNVRGVKNAFMIIIACFVVAVTLFLFVFGHPSHFDAEGFDGVSMWFAGDEFAKAHPVDLIGTVFKGGIIVPILQTLFLTVIVLSVERAIALKSAKGTGNIAKFVSDIKKCLASNNIAAAQELCKKQRGSVAAVVSAALTRYEEMDKKVRTVGDIIEFLKEQGADI